MRIDEPGVTCASMLRSVRCISSATRALLLLLWGCSTRTPPAATEPPSLPFVGGTVLHGYGVTIKKVAYVPNDRRQSFGVVAMCQPQDGKYCANRAWAPGEVDSLAKATALLGRMSGFETRVDTENPEVRIHARADEAPAAGCSDGSVTCWFGSTDCIDAGSVLLDRKGVPLVDHGRTSSWSFTACTRWSIEVSLVNVYAWAGFLKLDPEHVLRSVVLHEMGHTLGLEHASTGILRPHLPVCYFINAGDPRDKFSPDAGPDAFQRFECREGVKEPVLSAAQRAKLDAFQGGAPGWAFFGSDG